MMNLMIVEDEPPILREIKSTILSFPEEYTVEKCFFNAKDAIDYLNEYHENIDVLLTDIHLPVIDGLELIEYVSKHFPDILCIIISGYNEFEYAKKAIKLKVFDYLLKPVNEHELQEILNKAYAKIFLENLSPKKSLYPSTEYKATDQKTLYYLSYLCIGAYPNDSNSNSESLEQTWKKIEQNYFNIKLHTDKINHWLISGPSSSEKILLLSLTSDAVPLLPDILNTMINDLSTAALSITVVYLNETVNIHNLSQKTQLLRHFMKQHIYFGYSYLFCYDSASYESEDLNIFYYKLDKLTQLFKETNISLFDNELYSLLHSMKHQILTQKSVYQILNTLFTQCISLCVHRIGTKQLNNYSSVDDLLYLSFSYESLYLNLKLIFNDMFQLILDDSASNDKYAVLLRIDNYIKEHYKDPINTKIIADEFGFTPAYLSKIFKDYKNLSPSDYITSLRLQKATSLLSHSNNLSIKEVASYVGYDDSLYFSKVFKKNMNISPKQYQQEHT